MKDDEELNKKLQEIRDNFRASISNDPIDRLNASLNTAGLECMVSEKRYA